MSAKLITENSKVYIPSLSTKVYGVKPVENTYLFTAYDIKTGVDYTNELLFDKYGYPYDVNSYRLKDTLFVAHQATDYKRELLSSLYDKEFEKVLSDEELKQVIEFTMLCVTLEYFD